MGLQLGRVLVQSGLAARMGLLSTWDLPSHAPSFCPDVRRRVGGWAIAEAKRTNGGFTSGPVVELSLSYPAKAALSIERDFIILPLTSSGH